MPASEEDARKQFQEPLAQIAMLNKMAAAQLQPIADFLREKERQIGGWPILSNPIRG